jgi:hypothetical protein
MSDDLSLELLAKEFDEMCAARLDIGAAEYGPTAFVSADTIQMMLEELSDIVNYCKFTYIKLRLYQERLIAMEEFDYEVRTDSAGDNVTPNQR